MTPLFCQDHIWYETVQICKIHTKGRMPLNRSIGMVIKWWGLELCAILVLAISYFLFLKWNWREIQISNKLHDNVCIGYTSPINTCTYKKKKHVKMLSAWNGSILMKRSESISPTKLWSPNIDMIPSLTANEEILKCRGPHSENSTRPLSWLQCYIMWCL